MKDYLDKFNAAMQAVTWVLGYLLAWIIIHKNPLELRKER